MRQESNAEVAERIAEAGMSKGYSKQEWMMAILMELDKHDEQQQRKDDQQ